jgi:hypothetical protein
MKTRVTDDIARSYFSAFCIISLLFQETGSKFVQKDHILSFHY